MKRNEIEKWFLILVFYFLLIKPKEPLLLSFLIIGWSERKRTKRDRELMESLLFSFNLWSVSPSHRFKLMSRLFPSCSVHLFHFPPSIKSQCNVMKWNGMWECSSWTGDQVTSELTGSEQPLYRYLCFPWLFLCDAMWWKGKRKERTAPFIAPQHTIKPRERKGNRHEFN
jgi:hypothetical protein